MKQTKYSGRLLGPCLLFSLLLPACGGGGGSSPADPLPPAPAPPTFSYTAPVDNGDSWTVGNAADNGLDVGVLEDMVNDIRAGQFTFIDSVAIAKNGVLIFDETIRTATDSVDDKVSNTNPAMHGLFSVTKSITSLVVGIAIDEGHIADVDVPYLSLFPYPAYDNWNVRKDDMTLQHVLTMQTGLDWNEWVPPYSSPDNQWNRFIEEEVDFSKALLDLPMVADPGSVFAYSSAASVSLGQAVENAAPLSLIDFGLSELMLPLGITDIEVVTTPTGLPNGGNGFFLLARDATKFGQLLLNRGTWNNERIISEAWLTESLLPRVPVSWENPENWDWQVAGYGYQWWTGSYDFDGQQLDTFVAWGWGGQWIIAIPALELVVAIYGDAYDGADASTNEGHALVKRYILRAIN